MMEDMEREALSCAGLPQSRCRFSALVVCFGPLGTPYARVIRDLCSSWCSMLNNTDTSIPDIRSSWIKAKMLFDRVGYSFTRVHGIMSNVLVMLWQAGWNPIAFNVWIDSEGDQWELKPGSTVSHIVAAAITRSHYSLESQRASLHYNGKGMHGGVDWISHLVYYVVCDMYHNIHIDVP
jgi:hypothetical protein